MIIAEIGLNHEGDYDKAIMMLDQLPTDVIPKFQIYQADKLAHPSAISYWDSKLNPETSQHKNFQTQLTYDQYHQLIEHAHNKGMKVCASIFDLETLGEFPELDYYKVASGDITYRQLLEALAAGEKTTIISTGGAYPHEIEDAVRRCSPTVLLHCVQNYPTKPEEAALQNIKDLKYRFRHNTSLYFGYSCHVPFNLNLLMTAYNLGDGIIEKHYTFDKTRPGYDHNHSMDIKDLNELLDTIKEIQSYKQEYPINKLAKQQTRRSVVAKHAIKKNQTILKEDLICLRPETGIQANRINLVIAKRATRDIEANEILQWSDIHD